MIKKVNIEVKKNRKGNYMHESEEGSIKSVEKRV